MLKLKDAKGKVVGKVEDGEDPVIFDQPLELKTKEEEVEEDATTEE